MVNRNYLKCKTCGEIMMTRVALGHGDRKAFSFPCHLCKVALGFDMTLDQEHGTFQYHPHRGAEWILGDTPPQTQPAYVLFLDGENLTPIHLRHFSPFLATFSLPKDWPRYDEERKARFELAIDKWPLLKNLSVHRENRNDFLFDQTAAQLGFKGGFADWDERFRAELRASQNFFRLFRPNTSAEEALVHGHINDAVSQAGNQLPQVVQTLVDAHANEKMNAEIQTVRDGFMRIFPAVSGIYMSFSWDDAKHSLDDFLLAEKRFGDLKSLYVDCFETLGRLSVIAATLEGVIRFGSAVVPKSSGHMTTDAFQLMANGSKPDILKNLSIKDIFSVMNSQLRNGVGHNSATYDVLKDEVFYSNHSASRGVENFQISYTRFCEAVVKLYRMFEMAALYGDWLRAKVGGLTDPIV